MLPPVYLFASCLQGIAADAFTTVAPLVERSPLQSRKHLHQKANAVPLPSDPGAFEFPQPELRSRLSAHELECPLDVWTPLKQPLAGPRNSQALSDGVREGRQQSLCPPFRCSPAVTGVEPTPQELLAVRKAAGEQYAKTVLLTSTTPKSHALGQFVHTGQHLHSAQGIDLPLPHRHHGTSARVTEAYRPDPAQCLLEGPDSPCLLQRTAPPLPRPGASQDLRLHVHCGKSLRSRRPQSAGAQCWRTFDLEKRANASRAASFGHISHSLLSPSASPDELLQKHRVPQSHRSSIAMPHIAPASSSLVSQSRVRHRQGSESDSQLLRMPAAAEIRELSPPANQCSRSVTERLISAAEIEMSIRKLRHDRSPDRVHPAADEGNHGMSTAGMPAPERECHHYQPSTEESRPLAEEERSQEVSLRGGIPDGEAELGCSTDGSFSTGVGSGDRSPPFKDQASHRDTPDCGCSLSARALDAAQELCAAQRPAPHSECTIRNNAARIKSSPAPVQICPDSSDSTPHRLSIVEAYSRLGVSCPGDDAPALQPWDVNAWKSAWKASSVSGVGRAGLWTLEAISCIVWDRCAL